MRLPVIQGVIRRRILVNFRLDPGVMQAQLPAPFRPKLHCGHAIAGICLIRLEHERPQLVPAILGLSSENAAHRVAVQWTADGVEREGVFVPRRDTSSAVNRLVGGRLFPGEQNAARFTVRDDAGAIDFDMRSEDGRVAVRLRGRRADVLPPSSSFGSVAEASAFFEAGSLGYSVTEAGDRFDGLELRTNGWSVEPLAVEDVHSSYFSDRSRFPEGSVAFDCALVMRDREHEWRPIADLKRGAGG
jgi:hypothetical protein